MSKYYWFWRNSWLKNNDINKEVVHLTILNQQLSSLGNSSSAQPVKVILDDATLALKNGDHNKAVVHLNLAKQQLAMILQQQQQHHPRLKEQQHHILLIHRLIKFEQTILPITIRILFDFIFYVLLSDRPGHLTIYSY